MAFRHKTVLALATIAWWQCEKRPRFQIVRHGTERVGVQAGLRLPRKVQQHHVRAILHALKYDFMAVWGDVEIADIEVGSEIG